MSTKSILLLFLLNLAIGSCQRQKAQKHIALSAPFDLGKVNFRTKTKRAGEKYEVTVISRFDLEKNGFDGELSNYFQYQLGKKIKMIVDHDTVNPSLSFYVPLTSENEKEIDCKYVIDDREVKIQKQLIIDDTILNFNKVKIVFQ